jgi:hypothetical protein
VTTVPIQRKRNEIMTGTQQSAPSAPPVLTPEAEVIRQVEDLTTQLHTAANFRNPDLRPEVEAAQREELKAKAISATAATVAEVAAKAAAAAKKAIAAVDKFSFNPAQVETAASAAAWQLNILPTLESLAGTVPDWGMLVQHAGPDELAALAKFAPAYIRRNSKHNGIGVDHESEQTIKGLTGAIQRRGYAVNPDPKAREAVAAADAATATARATGRVAAELASGRVTGTQHLAQLTIGLKFARLKATPPSRPNARG